jgi:glycine/D-amino acid oxidase-like deaminating enzyme
VRSLVAGRYETVIVGGGIAGLACARRLQDSQRSFLLITENVGGRIRTSADGTVNVGAYYVRGDYSHVNQFVDRGRRIKRRHILRGDPDGSFTRWDVPLLLHPIQAVQFVRLMREFRRHYEVFKQDCLVMSQAQAIRADPLLRELYHEPAPRFIQRYRIEDIARSYLAPAVQGTAFTSVDRLTAFTLLVGVLPLIIPMFEYTARFDRLTAGFEDSLVFDSVTAIDATASGSYSIQTRNSSPFSADNVVVATPTDVSVSLLDLGRVKSPIDVHMFLVAGNLRSPWSRAAYALFPDGDRTFAIARQTEGSTLFCSASDDPDFGRYFSTWDVIERHHWNPAFHLEGDVLLECEQKAGLYLVGDHNVCNLEDAYITGIYAANRILTGHGNATPT